MNRKVRSAIHSGISLIFEYETQKIVQINSKTVGVIHRFIQFLIIAYIVGYVFIYQKGYQDFDGVISGVVTKVKGVSMTNRSDIDQKVWDVADFVVPSQEANAFFVTTNAIVTPHQTQGQCPEDPKVPGSSCKTDDDCPADEPILVGNGVRTGLCNNTTGTCEIYAWCPVEIDDLPAAASHPMLKNVANFTVLIKNSIMFTKFNVSRRNVIESYTEQQLQSCLYDPVKDAYCPIIKLGTILYLAGTSFDEIAVSGGVMSIGINWDCDLDRSPEYCLPKYTFRRLDDKNAKIAKGWNFRYANYYYMDGKQYRTLIKTFGIRFVIDVTGRAGRFNVIPLTMNLGSGLALLGIATIMCDMVVLYILSRRRVYRDAKFQHIVDQDAYKILESGNHTLIHSLDQPGPGLPPQAVPDTDRSTN